MLRDIGVVQQALLDLDAWILRGTAPPRSSAYEMDELNQVQLAATARSRGGVQPTVSLTGATAGRAPAHRVEGAVGQPVTLVVNAEVPPHAGEIVNVEWNVDGVSRFAAVHPQLRAQRRIRLQETFTPSQTGVFYPTVRVTSARNGDSNAPYGRVENLARIRVVVR